ncbi:hypothetical protein [Mycolicibacterium vanbaalenii]|uniref:Uncharacterized protein n=1 Tax=Mycolicibacterium vanbaalenii (strain DSM 7251 / JCM 13017 / BCRC 16820 / KCTC 9966 / NRRL B-24157 / PYR-1) TaxID=350058 RepID=A1THU1_MYCVP|nr:hypothetical protein [Mycolicibacterium vanbaalenii]ABM16741.1 hypothetical protein Mvan_5985 [Mycolicibacterium vanbaalenii PYR-1]MCV7128336.1 hypothetical protein [Mycolicibacterium vanbaalenii PYR-1]
MNHPTLLEGQPEDSADIAEYVDAEDFWTRHYAISNADEVRSVSEQNVARIQLVADAVAAGEYSLAKLTASRIAHIREDPEETLLEQLTARVIAEEGGVQPLVHLLAITGGPSRAVGVKGSPRPFGNAPRGCHVIPTRCSPQALGTS